MAACIIAISAAGAHAQGNPPQACPADPVAELTNLQAQIDALYLNAKDQGKIMASNLKAVHSEQGVAAASLLIAQYEETLFQWETQAQLLYEQVREINRCCFRAGKYLVWVSVERITQVWQKTYFKLLKITVKYFKTFYKVKTRFVNLSTAGCCLCNGIPNPAITNCASAPQLQQANCNVACLPFTSNGGQWFFQSMCDTVSGTCIPDP